MGEFMGIENGYRRCEIKSPVSGELTWEVWEGSLASDRKKGCLDFSEVMNTDTGGVFVVVGDGVSDKEKNGGQVSLGGEMNRLEGVVDGWWRENVLEKLDDINEELVPTMMAGKLGNVVRRLNEELLASNKDFRQAALALMWIERLEGVYFVAYGNLGDCRVTISSANVDEDDLVWSRALTVDDIGVYSPGAFTRDTKEGDKLWQALELKDVTEEDLKLWRRAGAGELSLVDKIRVVEVREKLLRFQDDLFDYYGSQIKGEITRVPGSVIPMPRTRMDRVVERNFGAMKVEGLSRVIVSTDGGHGGTNSEFLMRLFERFGMMGLFNWARAEINDDITFVALQREALKKIVGFTTNRDAK